MKEDCGDGTEGFLLDEQYRETEYFYTDSYGRSVVRVYLRYWSEEQGICRALLMKEQSSFRTFAFPGIDEAALVC